MMPTDEQLQENAWHFPQYTEESLSRALEAVLSDPNNPHGIIDLHTLQFVLADNSGSPVGILKRSYRSFDEYVADNPLGESFRNWIERNPSPLLIFPAWHGLPGGFFWAHPIRRRQSGIDLILVHDSDDGLWEKEITNSIEEEFRLLETLAPMTFQELGIFGYHP